MVKKKKQSFGHKNNHLVIKAVIWSQPILGLLSKNLIYKTKLHKDEQKLHTQKIMKFQVFDIYLRSIQMTHLTYVAESVLGQTTHLQ